MVRAGFFGTRIVAKFLMSVGVALGLVAATAASAFAQAEHVRWDIATPPPTVSAGGTATAAAQDGSTITMTGSGTFVAPGGGPGSNASREGMVLSTCSLKPSLQTLERRNEESVGSVGVREDAKEGARPAEFWMGRLEFLDHFLVLGQGKLAYQNLPSLGQHPLLTCGKPALPVPSPQVTYDLGHLVHITGGELFQVGLVPP